MLPLTNIALLASSSAAVRGVGATRDEGGVLVHKKSAERGIAKQNPGGGGQSSLQLGGWVGAQNVKCKSTENSSPNLVVTGPRHQLMSASHHYTCIMVLDGLFILRPGPRVV